MGIYGDRESVAELLEALVERYPEETAARLTESPRASMAAEAMPPAPPPAPQPNVMKTPARTEPQRNEQACLEAETLVLASNSQRPRWNLLLRAAGFVLGVVGSLIVVGALLLGMIWPPVFPDVPDILLGFIGTAIAVAGFATAFDSWGD